MVLESSSSATCRNLARKGVQLLAALVWVQILWALAVFAVRIYLGARSSKATPFLFLLRGFWGIMSEVRIVNVVKITHFLTLISPEKTELLLLVHRGGCTPKQLSFPERLRQPLLILCFESRKMVCGAGSNTKSKTRNEMVLLLCLLPLVPYAMQGSVIRGAVGFYGVEGGGSPDEGKVESLLHEDPTMRSSWNMFVHRRQLLREGQAMVSTVLLANYSFL